MTINDDFNRNKIVKMVNLSSNLNQNYISNKSKIPVKMFQAYNNVTSQFKYQKKISSNFKSNSSFNLTKIPKLIKMKNNDENTNHKLDASTLSTNTFNVASTEKLLKNRKSADRKNFKRSQSFNTDTNNVSSLSNKSNISSSNTSVHSFSSSKILNRNSEDLIKFIKRKLKEIEKSPSIDELADFLNEETKSSPYKRINLHTLETFRLRNISKSLPNSQLSHTNKLTAKLVKQSNTPNLENDSRMMNKNSKLIESYFSSLKILDQLFKSAHKELFQKALQIESDIGTDNEKTTHNLKTRKYQRKLEELIEKFNIIINDKESTDISLFSPESYIFSKQEYYKYGEYVLRLLSDLAFKFKLTLKLYSKIVESKNNNNNSNNNKNNTNHEQKTSDVLSKLPKIIKKKENETLESTTYLSVNKNKNSNVKTNSKQLDVNALKNSIENLNESFIKETDCSSIVSEDDDKERESRRSSYSHESNSKTKEKKSDNQIEDYKQLKKKIFFINEDLSDLNMYLDSLNLRAERCTKLEEQLKSDRDLIKKAELNLKLCDKSDDTFKHHLEKQLEYLKYRFKINLQDYNIEKICAPEIYSAISDTEFKIFKMNSYLQDLNMNLIYLESKLNVNKSKTKFESNVTNNFKTNYPRQLPPIHQYHTREFSLQQFE